MWYFFALSISLLKRMYVSVLCRVLMGLLTIAIDAFSLKNAHKPSTRVSVSCLNTFVFLEPTRRNHIGSKTFETVHTAIDETAQIYRYRPGGQ